MKNFQRLHCTYANRPPVAPSSRAALPRCRGALLALPLAMTIVVADAYAAVVNYTDVIQQGVDLTTGLTGAAALAATPDGTRLYVAATADSALAILNRDSGGALAPGDILLDDSAGGGNDGLSGAVDVAVSPDGNHVYTVALHDNAVSVFERTPSGLALVETQRGGTGGIAGLWFPNRIAVSPDGAHVYVATRDPAGADSIFAFAVSGANGKLGLLARYQEGSGGISGIADATGLVVSPDGRHVYVSGEGDDGVAVFARGTDPSSAAFGALSWVASYRDGIAGVDGMQGAGALALDPAGAYLYVAGTDEDAVAAFARDDASGELAFLAAYRNGDAGIAGLDGPLTLAVSPDGGHLYAAGTAQHALVVLRRDPPSGLLSALETHYNGDDGIVDGLDRALALVTSPDGAQLYTASPLAAKIGVFTLATADLELTVGAEAATAGDAAFRLTVANHGPAGASNLRLTDVLPAGASVADMALPAGAACTPAADRVVCELGALAAGATAELVLQLDLAAAGAGPNSGRVYADQRDPDVSNNSDGDAAQTNLAPVAVADSARTTPGTAVTVAVLANDSDPDGDALSVTANSTTSLHGGTITRNGDGTLTYVPATGFSGADSFDYTISDGLAEDAASVSVTVNTPPLARDDTATATASTAIEILVLSNDGDADADALQVGTVDAASAAGGTVVNNGDSVSYTPAAGFTGSDSFAYQVSDGLETATATVTVTVQPTGSGVSVDTPDEDDTEESEGGGGGLDAWWGLALLPWALGRRAPRSRPRKGPAAGRTAAPRR